MIPDSVRLSFYLGAAVFFVAVLWTVLKSKEYSPEEMASFEENQAREGTGPGAAHGGGVRAQRRPADPAGLRSSSPSGAPLSVWLASEAIYQVMILSAGIGGRRAAAHRQRAAAARRPVRQRLRHHPERLPGHARGP